MWKLHIFSLCLLLLASPVSLIGCFLKVGKLRIPLFLLISRILNSNFTYNMTRSKSPHADLPSYRTKTHRPFIFRRGLSLLRGKHPHMPLNFCRLPSRLPSRVSLSLTKTSSPTALTTLSPTTRSLLKASLSRRTSLSTPLPALTRPWTPPTKLSVSTS